MREPYSLEAEHGVLGAMMMRPELIDTLSTDLKSSDFYWPENAQVFEAIHALQANSKAVDYFTVADKIQVFADGTHALGYTAEIVKNTPSVASAKDYAGIVRDRAVDRAILAVGERITEIGTSDRSAEDKIAAIQTEALSIDSESASAEIVSAWDVLSAHLPILERREELQGRMDGLSTGIADLDEQLQGLKPEQLIIIAGRPAMGKTTLAMNIAAHVAIRQRKQVLAVSLEMSNSQLMDRFLAAEGKIPLQDLKSGRGAKGENGLRLNAAASKIKDSGLKMSDRSGMTISQVRAAARRHKRRFGLDLIVIDYLQLLESEGRSDNRVNEVSAMSRGAKLMARELQCPVIMLSQLSRKCEERPNKRPICSDLRESGAIEQDADIIAFVYRDEVYNPDSEYKGVAEIIIGKGRDIETGTVRTAFLGQYSRFEQLDGKSLHEMHERAAEKKDTGRSMTSRYGSQKRAEVPA